MRLCVLLGGESNERSVSIASGVAFGAALLRGGHSVLFLDPATGENEEHHPGDSPDGLAERLAGRSGPIRPRSSLRWRG